MMLSLALVCLCLTCCFTEAQFISSVASGHRHTARAHPNLKTASESAVLDIWAVAAAPHYLWLGTFSDSGLLLQKVNRTSLVVTANVSLPNQIFVDHIMLSPDNSLIYVNV